MLAVLAALNQYTNSPEYIVSQMKSGNDEERAKLETKLISLSEGKESGDYTKEHYQFCLAYAYEKCGNLEESIKWYRRVCSTLFSKESFVRLTTLLILTGQDKTKAQQREIFGLWKKSLQSNRETKLPNPTSLYNIGIAYCTGTFGRKKNQTTAEKYFRRGAKQRNSGCLLLLGVIESEKKSFTKAMEFFIQSVRGGNIKARLHLALLFAEMAKEEKEQEKINHYKMLSLLWAASIMDAKSTNDKLLSLDQAKKDAKWFVENNSKPGSLEKLIEITRKEPIYAYD